MDGTLKSYSSRWEAVEAVENQELQNATLELRWQQLNAAIGIAIGLGIFRPSEIDMRIIRRWAELKEKTASQHPVV